MKFKMIWKIAVIYQYINFSVLYKSDTKNRYSIAIYAKPRPKYQYWMLNINSTEIFIISVYA